MATRRPAPLRPAQTVALAFTVLILIGAGFLSMPFSRADGRANFDLSSLFTAVSALCVNGLTTVNTETTWTPVGHVVILALIKIGGFGIMAFTALLAVLVAHRMSLRASMVSSEEHRAFANGDIKAALLRIAAMGVGIELVGALVIAARLIVGYGYNLGDAAWYGVFHSVSAFNNAGMSLFGDNLVRFNADPVILLTLSLQVILGSVGFPVLIEVARRLRGLTLKNRSGQFSAALIRWSLTTRIVLAGTGILLVLGFFYFALLEWNNSKTLGSMGFGQKLLNAFVLSVMPRTAGFNAVDIGQLSPESWLGMDVLMFIGGASGGTAGGLKITTVAVLLFIVIGEIRSSRAINIGKRRLPRSLHRQALTLLFLYGTILIGATVLLQLLTEFSTDQVLFEASSALSAVGLSTGITPLLPPSAQVLIMILMFIGRVGPALVASSLAVRVGKSFVQYPKERLTIG